MFELEQFIKDFFKIPTPAHRDKWIEVSVDMAVHTKHAIPAKLISEMRPNETKEIYNYRIKNYRAITYGSMNRALDKLYRILNGVNYKVNAPEDTLNLLTERVFKGMPFALYLQQNIMRRMIEDPNGLLCWLPPSGWEFDKSQKMIPQPYFVCSADIHYVSNDVIAFLSKEKSLVRVGKEEVYEGTVFYILTKDTFYKLQQFGKKSDERYELFNVYQHNIGQIPYCVLGGDLTDEGYLNSYFSPYLAFGDEAICVFSDWQAIMINSNYPYTEEFIEECEITEEPNTQNNPIAPDEETYQKTRTVYKRMVRSPHGTIERKIPGNEENAFGQKPLDPAVPSIRFIQSNVANVEYSGKSWDNLILKAEDALHLNLGRGLLSGAAKELDKDGEEDMTTKIGTNFYDNIMLSSIIFIDAYYGYHKVDYSVSIDKPSTFNFSTQEELIDDISKLRSANVPAFFIQQKSVELATKAFSGNRLAAKIYKIISIEDALNIYTQGEKNQMVIAGTATKEEVIRSNRMFSLLMKIAHDVTTEAFLKMELDAIMVEFDELIVEYIPEHVTPPTNPDGTTA